MTTATETYLIRTNRSAARMSEFPEEVPLQLAAILNRLGDGKYEHLSISKLPAGTPYDEFPYTEEWLQAAGTAQRLTVEVKKRDADGVCRLYALGRSDAAGEQTESETITVGQNTTKVRPAEVLTAKDALGVFEHYHAHNTVPEGWSLRLQPEFSDDLVAEQLANGQTEPAPSASATTGDQTAPGAVADTTDQAVPGKRAEGESEQEQHRTNGA